MHANMRTIAVPSDPVARLWHSAQMLREHRGDGHIVALSSARFGGTEQCLTILRVKDQQREASSGEPALAGASTRVRLLARRWEAVPVAMVVPLKVRVDRRPCDPVGGPGSAHCVDGQAVRASSVPSAAVVLAANRP
jgi:hypothetical protein